MRRALITGIGGQDGSYLAELLLARGYEVFGLVRRPGPYANLAGISDRVELLQADLLDELSLVDSLQSCRPHELYNLAAPSFVPMSWKQPVVTAEFAAVGVTALLEAVRLVEPGIRVYQASSSEIFGDPQSVPQTEETALRPLTPYGVAKAYGHFIVQAYRRRYGLHASCGILYNHESPRRPVDYLPSKVANAAAGIKLGLSGELWLGDLSARRDWGYAADYVRAMWLMVQQERPDDYIVATGITHSVQDLVELTFAHLDLDWREYVHLDESLRRGKAELHDLVGDATKARERLDWHPDVDFPQLVRLLVDAELERLARANEPVTPQR